ncbi:Phage coat protein [Vibrio chagasii]|nr:Phage coat protein [Vibrio chagasii]
MFNSIRKMSKPVVATSAIILMSSPAFAVEGGSTSAVDQILGAVDLSTVTTFIGTTGVVIVGIALAVKGISLAKRLVSRA